MRTKTVLLSVLLSALGAVAVNAQTNVYSLNAVGYINETIYPGFNLIACPLIASPDNTLNTLLPPTNKAYKNWQVWVYNPTNTPAYTEDIGLANVWGSGGTETIAPGNGAWLYNPGANPSNVIFVGTVPTGPITNTLYSASFNLVGSAVPASGDLLTNPITAFSTGVKHDQVWTYNPTNSPAYTEYIATGNNTATNWPTGDPIIPGVGSGFWYYNAQATNNYWVENFQL